ncbi:hypothetical protein clem_08255 [Legionella clemsonensis]|uniref:Uncharacterized protein n=1 Tax=Legionella clemsonensis TaxID=1867846 RepID=A0A222P2Y6_9GAMM|nr:hypothetical protein clem_08255 [Legionella clemsonensis]
MSKVPPDLTRFEEDPIFLFQKEYNSLILQCRCAESNCGPIDYETLLYRYQTISFNFKNSKKPFIYKK